MKIRRILPSVQRTVSLGSAVVIGAVMLIGTFTMALPVFADTYTQQISTLNQKTSQAKQSLGQLQLQANSYQDALRQLQQQVVALRRAIAASESEQVNLQHQMDQAEAKLVHQKKILSDDITTMYVSGNMSTLEILASSKNLSDYIDKQEYRIAVQDSINHQVTKINQLKASITAQQEQVSQLLQKQKLQQSQLSTSESKQSQLLNMNQSQQNQYNQEIQANKAQVAKLYAEQAAANARIARAAHVVGSSGGSGGACDLGEGNGGYPLSWCNAPFTFNYSPIDANGFPMRQCTSFAYWYFTSVEGQTNFSVSGNAGWWWETSNYPTTTWGPNAVKDGALGIEPSSSLNAPVPSLHGGYYGHVMIVKAKPGEYYPGYGKVPSGYVLVASMNEDEAGHFMYNLWPVDYLMYINPK